MGWVSAAIRPLLLGEIGENALRLASIVVLAVVAGLAAASGHGASGNSQVTLLSTTHRIDRIYPSMQGPASQHAGIFLSGGSPRHVVWITGLDSQVVAADGASAVSQEYFCHSNLSFDPGQKLDTIGRAQSSDERLFTLIPGRRSIHLPPGFAIPVWSDEALNYFTMSLNLNHVGDPVEVRFRTIVRFRDGASASDQLKPLFRRAVYAFEPIGQASPHAQCMGGDQAGASCGPSMCQAASSAFVASLGKTNTIHWLIPPGGFESRVPVSNQLNLPYDTTAHYVTGHLHPYGKSLSLRDTTTAKTVFEITSKDFTDKLGVAEMTEWSSAEGVELHKDHQYELVTTYHNPTDHPIDAMSILYVYARDKQFRAGP